MKKYFCSFADTQMYRSLNRIGKQAEAMQFYDGIMLFDEKKLDPKFYNDFKAQLKFATRGFGYWVWKPQIILQALAQMQNGDILQYTDAGCHLNPNGKKRLQEYFDMANNSSTGMLGIQSIEPADNNLVKSWIGLEKHWTKGDIFDYFKVRDRADIFNTEQIMGTVLFIKKTPNTLLFIQQWLQVFYDDFSLVTDAPSKSPNFPGWLENRHDQSVLSILAKLHHIPTVSICEMHQDNMNRLGNYPIHIRWDKDLGLLSRIKRKILKTIYAIRYPTHTERPKN